MSNIDDAFIKETFPNIAGNHADDDAQYVDELFRVNPDSVAMEDLPRGIPLENPTFVPRGKNRLVARTYTVDRSYGPIMLLPADPNRSELHVNVASDNAFLSDTKDTLTSAAGRANAFALYEFNEYVLDNYTGPVWMVSEQSNPGSTVTFSVLAVTD